MFRPLARLVPLLALLALPAPGALAEARAPFDDPGSVTLADYLPAGADHDPTIPVPASVLGHEVGERHARHGAMVAWFRDLAAASERVALREIGRSWEGRPQITAVISSPENLARLDELRRAHLDGDPDAPLVLWLGYSVHGNEASGLQASMPVAYHLAAARGDGEVDALLDEAIVLIDPSINPDGYGRFSTWANAAAGVRGVTEPEDRQRDEPWPGGRTNHYWFDLNRDWLLLQHPESRNRVALMRDFRPHVVTDHHEMGADATFFFQPGVPERKNPLIPERNVELTGAIGEYHAAALDGAGRAYYTQESFDDFYPGKGSTWPDLQGAVGILFEQASTRGLVRETANGLLTLPMGVHNQVLASFSTLRAARALSDELKAFRRAADAGEFVPDDLPAAWVVDLGDDGGRARGLLDVLEGQGLAVRTLTDDLRADDHRYAAGRSIVVPVDGPRALLAHALFAPQDTFTDSTFYDVSTWSLQHAFGMRAAPLRRLPGDTAALAPPARATGVRGTSDAAAWILRWDDFHAPTVLQRIHEAGIRATLAPTAFTAPADGAPLAFAPGSVVVQAADVRAAAEREDTTTAALLARLAGDDGVLVGVDTGLTPTGPDLGSRDAPVLEPTSVALLAGEGVRSYSAGSLWHALDARLRIPVALIDPADLDAAILDRHTHLVLPDGRYDALGEETTEALDRWIRAGGVLVAVRRGASFAQAQGWLPRADTEDPEDAETAPEATPERLPYGTMADRDGAQQIGGAILEVDLDPTHPLAFGIDRERIGLLRRGRHPLAAPADNPFTVVGAYTDAPRLSGYLPEDFAGEVAGAPAILAVPVGEGAVIAFADAPAFRGVWWVGQRLLANAIAFGAIIEAPRGDYGAAD
jgi:hypothetical protein